MMAMAAPARPEVSREEELFWLALHLAPGLGPRKAIQLLGVFRSPRDVFRASADELESAGLGGALARSLASGCVFEEAAAQQERMLAAGARLIHYGHTEYPDRLRGIYDPPVALFVRGRAELLGAVNIGIVGTRRPSAYGLAAAERIAGELAAAGVSIASGMARGIDTKAHQAALAVEGDTVAIFGCGVDVVYPSENRKLAEQIAQKGLLVSEFAMGSPGYPQNFPVRNRIISGISAGVLVVEGAQYSGSAITAKLALDQGREVFAIPGNITSPMSWAPNLLIKQGAKLVQEWNDVVAELPGEDRARLAARRRQELLEFDPTSEPVTNKPLIDPAAPNAGTQRALLQQLAFDKPVQLDHLMELLEGHSASELIAGLFELELQGLVRQLPGRSYIKVWVD
jgi:DNA processing protein